MIDPAALQEELAKIRARGYATDDEEYELGVRGIASPIRDDSGNSVAAVGVSGPAQRLTKNRLRALAGHVNAAATAISLRLGAKASPRQANSSASLGPDTSEMQIGPTALQL
jgi:DNA-binding IclR family transcriptional regulator